MPVPIYSKGTRLMKNKEKQDHPMFERFHGSEVDRYTYYTIPQALFKDPYFGNLSIAAKVTYAVLLNRTSLSIRNNWFDENGDVYIIYPIAELAEDIGVHQNSVTKYMKELSSVGLVEKERIGLNKADIIYVLNFTRRLINTDQSDPDVPAPGSENQTDSNQDNAGQFPENEAESRINSGITNIVNQESQGPNFRNHKNCESGITNIVNQESQSLGSNNTNINNTYSSYPESINQSYQSVDQSMETQDAAHPIDKIDQIDKRSDHSGYSSRHKNFDAYMNLIKTNIEYDTLISVSPQDKDLLDDIINLMTDVTCSNSDSITVGKENKDGDIVRSQLLKLNREHIDYVLEALHKTKSKINNPRAYLLTALYNAPHSLTTYWQTRAQHDMYGDYA